MTHGTTPLRDPVSEVVLEHVAQRTDRGVLELPPLYETLNPDVLDHLVASAQRNDTSLSVQFTYAGHHVTIDQNVDIRCEQQ